jgi:hypothetical protein
VQELTPSEAAKVATAMMDMQKSLPCVKSGTVGNAVFEVCPGDFVRQVTNGVSVQLGMNPVLCANYGGTVIVARGKWG